GSCNSPFLRPPILSLQALGVSIRKATRKRRIDEHGRADIQQDFQGERSCRQQRAAGGPAHYCRRTVTGTRWSAERGGRGLVLPRERWGRSAAGRDAGDEAYRGPAVAC